MANSIHETTFAASGLPVVFSFHARAVTYIRTNDAEVSINAIVGPEETAEDKSRRGRKVIRQRQIIIRTDASDSEDRVTEPQINQEAVVIDGQTYSVITAEPHGENFAQLTVAREAVAGSERETFRDY